MKKTAFIILAVFCAALLLGFNPRAAERSSQAGAWTAIGGNSPWSAECIAVNASNPNEVFIGNNGGFFYSKNTGASWTDLWRDLPAKSVLSIHIDGSARKVYVGTQGGGICRRSF